MKRPLVILGMKVGDPECIERWAEEGHLPTIASLMERGCWGRIEGPERIAEHGSSLSLFSGLSLGQHQYYYFRRLKPGSYELEAVTAQVAQAPPFWADWTGGDKKVCIVDAPEIFLVDGPSGVQVANWSFQQAGPAVQALACEPAAALEDIRRQVGPPPSVPLVDTRAAPAADGRVLEALLANVETKGRLCRHLAGRGNFALCVAVFDETHRAAHQFWKYRPEAGGAEQDPLTHAIRQLYRAIDRELGTLLKELPEEANVFFFSLFGMEDQYPTAGLNEAFFRRLGYHAARPAGHSFPRPLDLARRVLPESWRVALGRRLSSRRQEDLMRDRLSQGTDWERTTAFAIPSLHTCFARVNLKGREPQGIVDPGAEYEAVLEGLEADFRQLVDPETGAGAIDQIVRPAAVFGGGPSPVLPDLLVEWKALPRLRRRVVHPRAALVQPEPEYCPINEETLSGFVAACGPGIGGRGALGPVSLVDLAPTFLRLVGEPIPPRMKGRPLEALLGG